MEFIIVCFVALLASGLTLFSGFGLGTLLLPAFLAFFPVHLAIAMTA
ncbi:MAG: sulfite exporter TauE/SafE family protein, partial [Ignavibacteria bacterium]|nr:sulfite exporter TauE/SafE family protein [Ignavibacteria bacterium]